jgi:hypothetical protein
MKRYSNHIQNINDYRVKKKHDLTEETYSILQCLN